MNCIKTSKTIWIGENESGSKKSAMIIAKHWKKDTDESRKEGASVTEEIGWLAEKEDWKSLKSVVMVESIREIIGKEPTVERRYFISSLEANAKELLRCVRGHWAIENELHWCLDIGFREDNCQVREAVSAENLATLRHIGINLLKQEKSSRRGIEGKRKKAGWDENYLLEGVRKSV